MRVLGIDCGTERTGWGVIESDGRSHRVLAHGVIRTARQEASGAAPGCDRRGAARRAAESSARGGRGGRSVLFAEREDRAEAGARARRGAAGHRRGRIDAGRIFAAASQDQRGGLRPRRKAAGADDGADAHGACRESSNPKTPPTRWPWRSATRPRRSRDAAPGGRLR